MRKFLEPLLWVLGIGVFITVSLVIGVWGISKVTIEVQYLTLDERVRMTAAYATLDSDTERFAYLKTQVPLARPLVQFNTSLAGECRFLYESFNVAMREAAAVTAKYSPPPFDATTLSAEDAAKVDTYTDAAIELLRRYNECAGG